MISVESIALAKNAEINGLRVQGQASSARSGFTSIGFRAKIAP
jgi:hypothetical protein